mmetsp:Transcript_11379/g.33989  ORF Transcript_11379/g.33989 Transcript_11379/m.33989 type:complete len:94 (+) Transcript_11379:200-481(+)
MGAMLLVGTVGNPLVALCEQLGCRLHALDRTQCPLYDGEELLDPLVDARAQALFDGFLEETQRLREKRVPKRKASLGISEGGRWEREELRINN